MGKKISAKTRGEVIFRADGFCEYCRSDSKFAESPYDVEHITPQSKGGKSELNNLALACHGCNLFKAAKTEFFDSVINKNIRLFNPRTDVWHRHFSWTSDFSEIIGLTAIGRATIEALKLNRENLINQRKRFYKSDKYPPDQI